MSFKDHIKLGYQLEYNIISTKQWFYSDYYCTVSFTTLWLLQKSNNFTLKKTKIIEWWEYTKVSVILWLTITKSKYSLSKTMLNYNGLVGTKLYRKLK